MAYKLTLLNLQEGGAEPQAAEIPAFDVSLSVPESLKLQRKPVSYVIMPLEFANGTSAPRSMERVFTLAARDAGIEDYPEMIEEIGTTSLSATMATDSETNPEAPDDPRNRIYKCRIAFSQPHIDYLKKIGVTVQTAEPRNYRRLSLPRKGHQVFSA